MPQRRLIQADGLGATAMRTSADLSLVPRLVLPQAVSRELARHPGTPGSLDDLVFTAPQGGPLRVTALRAPVWRPATGAAGLEVLRIPDLRHTAVAPGGPGTR